MKHQDSSPESSNLSRRDVLRRGILGVSALGAMAANASAGSVAPQSALPEESFPDDIFEGMEDLFASSCTLTPNNVQGPFWLNLAMMRQDITEGLAGYPMSLYLKIVDSTNCAPIAGAVADVWHDSPDGHYSGFAAEGTAGLTHLRGIQVANAGGIVRFDTIYPGWYQGRTPHLHLKVNPNAGAELTTQLYFDDNISDQVFQNVAPYNTRGSSPTTNATDNFYLAALGMTFRMRQGRLLAGKRIVIA